MFRRTYLGLEIRGDGLRAIAIQRAGAGVALLGGQSLDFSEGVLNPVAQEPNVNKPELFIDGVRQVLLPLARRENRIAVALPDAVGQVFLLEVDSPFKHQKEGEEIIRWHLKDLLPGKLKKSALSYQVLEARESGSKRVLASAISREVLEQYEALLARAGFAAEVIDFHSMNIFNAYRDRIELGSDFILVSVVGPQLSMLVFENLKLIFYRAKPVVGDAGRVFQELNRTMMGCRRAHGPLPRSAVYLHTDWAQAEELLEAVGSTFERDPELLPSPLQKLVNAKNMDLSPIRFQGMAAALGIAERLIKRVN